MWAMHLIQLLFVIFMIAQGKRMVNIWSCETEGISLFTVPLSYFCQYAENYTRIGYFQASGSDSLRNILSSLNPQCWHILLKL